jgi:hypothetical protein
MAGSVGLPAFDPAHITPQSMAGKVRRIHSEVGQRGVFFADALARSKTCKVFAAFWTSKK